MRFISKKFGDEKFNFLDLLNIEGKIKKIYLASAYCETDVIYKIKNSIKEQISASGCDFLIFMDKYANNAWLGQELISKFRRLNTKLKNEMSTASEIYFVENKGKLFHSKILFIETTKCVKIYMGSMNFTERGINFDENEEILVEFEKNITANNKFVLDIENYFKKLKKISLPLSEQNSLVAHNNYSSARDFFLSGQVFFEFANSRFFNFSLGIPDEIKKGVSSLHSSLIDVIQDNIDVVKMVCSIERQSSRQSWKRYTVETPYGYWAPKEFLESIFEIIDEKSSFKEDTVKILEKLANKNEVENIMLPYFQEISDSIYQKFPDCGWNYDKLVIRWNSWYKKLLKKIENNTDGELNLILKRYISGISWCTLPDLWDDTFLRENFESCFLDSIETKGSLPKQTNKFVKFLKSNYTEYPFEDFKEFEKILKDKEFSKKLIEFLDE